MDYAVSNFLINNQKKYKYYLFMININTRFLFVSPVNENVTPSIEITRILVEDINDHLKSLGENFKINNIRADGDSKFGKMIGDTDWDKLYLKDNSKNPTIRLGDFDYQRNSFLEYLSSEHISLYLNSSPFINKNRVVDRVIRTIRDKLSIREQFWLDANYMAVVVNEYNNTPHNAFYGQFTPFEVQFTRDLERYFIRENEYKLEQINEMQEKANLRDYKPGNILLVHLDFAKTKSRFSKKRRVFNKLAEFISYDFGNVKCNVFNVTDKYVKNPVTLPIYYTKYLAENEKSIPQRYRELFRGIMN